MIRYNPLLCLDFYKTAHAEQYPQTLTKMVSYYTPRMTRLEDTDKVTMFGLQAFIKEYLVDAFDLFFFWEDWEDVLAEYKRVLNATINTDGVGEKRLKALHDLGYQAFLCYAIGLFLIDCILELFTDKPVDQTVKRGLTYIGIIVASLVSYYLIMMVFLAIKGTALSSYQGFDTVDPMDFAGFLSKIPQAYKDFWSYFKLPPFRTSPYRVIQLLFLFLAGGAMTYLTVISKVYRNWRKLLLLLLGISLLPLALNFVTILVQEGTVHALMIYSFVLLYVFSLKIVEMALQNHRTGRYCTFVV